MGQTIEEVSLINKLPPFPAQFTTFANTQVLDNKYNCTMFQLDFPIHLAYTTRTCKDRTALTSLSALPQRKVTETSGLRGGIFGRESTFLRNVDKDRDSSQTVSSLSKNSFDQKEMTFPDFMEEDRLGYGFEFDDGISPPPLNLSKLSSSHNTCKANGDKTLPSSVIGGLSLEEILYVAQTLQNQDESCKTYGNQCVLRHCKMKHKRLLRNIRKSFPNCRLLSRRNRLCYRKASKYIHAFKMFCFSSCDLLLRHENWELVIEYVLQTWTMVSQLPDWEDKVHNFSKKHCYKKLADTCCTAIGSGQVTNLPLDTVKRLRQTASLNSSILDCVEMFPFTLPQ